MHDSLWALLIARFSHCPLGLSIRVDIDVELMYWKRFIAHFFIIQKTTNSCSAGRTRTKSRNGPAKCACLIELIGMFLVYMACCLLTLFVSALKYYFVHIYILFIMSILVIFRYVSNAFLSSHIYIHVSCTQYTISHSRFKPNRLSLNNVLFSYVSGNTSNNPTFPVKWPPLVKAS